MVWVKRGENGVVVSVSLEPDGQHPDPADPADVGVQGFVQALTGSDTLAGSDLRLVRVIEDLIDLLIERDVIRFTDLPDAAQEKLMQRRSMRASKSSLDLISGGDELI
ncbi:MAG: hypothetical protein KDG52_19965 [Rhodocyclaceae bacterium]|nr:hypothetical protein [Rhodocyclaceae bacterium]